MKNMRIRAGIVAVTIIVLLAINSWMETHWCRVQPETNFKLFQAKLETVVPELMSKYNIPGTAIALVLDGKTVAVKGYGWSDKENRIRVDEKTAFQVASNSKTFAAWGVMRLVQKGVLDLDTPVSEYLKSWHLPESKYDNNQVSLRRILSHTAGLSTQSYAGYPPDMKLPSLEQSLSGQVKGTKGIYLKWKPGVKYRYTGGGYAIAQLIVEEVTGKPFAQYMKEEVLMPLGMTNSSYEWKDGIINVSKAYDVLGGKLPNYMFTEQAAAGLYTTATDFAKFVEANIKAINPKNGEKTILNSDTLSLMLTPVDTEEDYGLAYIIKQLPDGKRLVYHGGTNRGWRAQFAFLPEKRNGLVVLTNSENGENLHNDLVSFWTKWETGYYPDFKIKVVAFRVLTRSAAMAVFLLMALYIWKFAGEVRMKKRCFAPTAGIKSPKYILNIFVKLLSPLLLIAVWLFLFYTGMVYNGWTFASFMPYGFQGVTVAVCLFCIFLSVRSLFVINREIKSKPQTTGLDA